MIRAVLFDFGGVLTESGKTGFVRDTIAGLYGIAPETLDIAQRHHALRRGKGDDDAFFAELNARYGRTVTKEMFAEKARAMFSPSSEVYELAASLRRHGIRTGILSNIFAVNAQDLRKAGSYEGFDPVILSCEEGYAKPEKAFYELALSKLQLPGDEVLFIDDQQKCLPPAQALGMHTITAINPGQIVADTTALLQKMNGISV